MSMALTGPFPSEGDERFRAPDGDFQQAAGEHVGLGGVAEYDFEVQQFKIAFAAAEGVQHHQRQRAVGVLVLVAQPLLVLDAREQLGDAGIVFGRIGRKLAQPLGDGGPAALVGNEDAAAVPDLRGVGVLKGGGPLLLPVDMGARLMPEGVAADVGRALVERDVGDVRNPPRAAGQQPQPVGAAGRKAPF